MTFVRTLAQKVPAIRRIFVASNTTANLQPSMRKALRHAGFGDSIAVEELKFDGPLYNVVLPKETLQRLPDIGYLMADPDIIHLVFKEDRSKLVWAHSTWAGVDCFFKAMATTKKSPEFILTRQFHTYGRQMAEYVLGRIIYRERQFGVVHEMQKEKQFPDPNTIGDGDLYRFRTLDHLHIGILGFGELGQTVAQCCRAMGMTVWAAVRDERYSNTQHKELFDQVHHVRPMSRLAEMLESCDYVVSILPSSPRTRNLLSGDVLEPCQKKKTVLISVGRGDVIDDHSLIKALRNGWLGGAILDVFNTEPLPPSSELWTLPGVTITPHYAAASLFGETQVDSFVHNLKCLVEGKPMRGVVDFTKGY